MKTVPLIVSMILLVMVAADNSVSEISFIEDVAPSAVLYVNGTVLTGIEFKDVYAKCVIFGGVGTYKFGNQSGEIEEGNFKGTKNVQVKITQSGDYKYYCEVKDAKGSVRSQISRHVHSAPEYLKYLYHLKE